MVNILYQLSQKQNLYSVKYICFKIQTYFLTDGHKKLTVNSKKLLKRPKNC